MTFSWIFNLIQFLFSIRNGEQFSGTIVKVEKSSTKVGDFTAVLKPDEHKNAASGKPKPSARTNNNLMALVAPK